MVAPPTVPGKTESGNEPVREWLKSLPADERKQIGADVLTGLAQGASEPAAPEQAAPPPGRQTYLLYILGAALAVSVLINIVLLFK